jgi:hypothetical protein
MTSRVDRILPSRGTEDGASPPATNPYVFIVGCPRSGTTLLKRMIDAHPQIGISRATYWIPSWFEQRRGLTPDGFVTPALISKLLAYRKFSKMNIDRSELEALLASEEPMPYSRFVSGIFDLYGKKRSKPLVGDKTPGYVRRLSTLHDLWPTARFIHLIRDGRDVCLSTLHWRKADKKRQRYPTWAEDPVSTAALWWEWQVRRGLEAGSSLGDGLYRELRYESLVARPKEQCASVSSFLSVPYSEAMLRFHEGRTQEASESKRRWMPATRGLRDWRTQMDPDHVERFEAVASDLLEELGYERGISRPRPQALAHATRLRARFSSGMVARGECPPLRW